MKLQCVCVSLSLSLSLSVSLCLSLSLSLSLDEEAELLQRKGPDRRSNSIIHRISLQYSGTKGIQQATTAEGPRPDNYRMA